MIVHSWRRMAALVLAIAASTLATGGKADADGARSPLVVRANDDDCDPQDARRCSSLCRKFKLHSLYARKSCVRTYVRVPYGPPDLEARQMGPGTYWGGYGGPQPGWGALAGQGGYCPNGACPAR